VVLALEALDLLQCLGEFHLVFRLDALADETERVAVGDGGVVIIAVDIISESALDG